MINAVFDKAIALFDKSDWKGCGDALTAGILSLTQADRVAITDLDHEELAELWVACDMSNLTDIQEGPIRNFCDYISALGDEKTPPELQEMFARWERERKQEGRNLRVVK
ncbi:MAG: hypothetical protein HQK58_16765 [Deltaproteobacteria bacterium]|nr:hypothetical protein [Deltaproteobacteria bacterium]